MSDWPRLTPSSWPLVHLTFPPLTSPHPGDYHLPRHGPSPPLPNLLSAVRHQPALVLFICNNISMQQAISAIWTPEGSPISLMSSDKEVEQKVWDWDLAVKAYSRVALLFLLPLQSSSPPVWPSSLSLMVKLAPKVPPRGVFRMGFLQARWFSINSPKTCPLRWLETLNYPQVWVCEGATCVFAGMGSSTPHHADRNK